MRHSFLIIAVTAGLTVPSLVGAAEDGLSKEERLYFEVLDQDGNGKIERSELETITGLIFRMADLNGDGGVAKDEMKKINGIVRAIQKLR